jgi:hypothetical protein
MGGGASASFFTGEGATGVSTGALAMGAGVGAGGTGGGGATGSTGLGRGGGAFGSTRRVGAPVVPTLRKVGGGGALVATRFRVFKTVRLGPEGVSSTEAEVDDSGAFTAFFSGSVLVSLSDFLAFGVIISFGRFFRFCHFGRWRVRGFGLGLRHGDGFRFYNFRRCFRFPCIFKRFFG